MKLTLTALILTGLAVFAVNSPARAQELVTNGGFETGDLTGWTSPMGANTVSSGLFSHTGSYGLDYTAVGFDAPLSQTLHTTIGDTETITFWQHEYDSIPNEVKLMFGGVALLTLTDLPESGWIEYTATATATSSSTVLTFGLRQDINFSALDDISVIQSRPSNSNVPEPGAYALLGSLGMTGAALLHRKRTR